MSAIGDYVHFMTSNYVKYGTGKFGHKNFHLTSFENYKKQRLKNITKVSPNTINQLEMRLKENSDQQINADGQAVNTEIQKRIDYIYEILEETTSTEALKKFLENNIAKSSNQLIQGKMSTTSEIKALREKVKEFVGLLKMFKESTTMKTDTFQRRAERLITLYNEITNSTETMISEQDISTRNKKSVIGKLQTEIVNNGFNTTQAALRGAFGELLVASCGDIVKGKTKEVAKNLIESAVQGSERSNIEISKDVFGDLDISQIKSFSKVLDDGSTLSFGSSQDKVDVKITVKHENVLASVKNYNLLEWEGLQKWGIHLQTVNLLYALLAMIDSGYTNHWLNLHAANIQPVNISGISQDEVDEGVRFEVLYEAFASGNPLKSNSEDANVFVIMDSKTGKLKVIDTKEVLNNDLLRKKSFKISHENNITSPKIINKKIIGDNGADIRIENILNQIHRLKVSVSYNVDSINF